MGGGGEMEQKESQRSNNRSHTILAIAPTLGMRFVVTGDVPRMTKF